MRARLAALCARKAGHRKNVGVENPTNIYMGFALVLMVLAGTSVAHSLICDWRTSKKQQAKKIMATAKFFSAKPTGPLPGRDLPPQPLPMASTFTASGVGHAQSVDCQAAASFA